MLRAEIQPDMPRWARERAGFGLAEPDGRFPKLTARERGESAPALKQLEACTKAGRVLHHEQCRAVICVGAIGKIDVWKEAV